MPRWFVAVPFWIAIPAMLLWWTFLLLLTAGFLIIIAASGLVWCAGWLLAKWKPQAGASTMLVGLVAYKLAVHLCDGMNGHNKKPVAP
jgi:hypothetical protein